MKEKDELGHRLMSYLYNRTSDKNQECREWRNVTLKFFYNLYELMDKNPALDVYAWEVDGIRISYGEKRIAYIHFRQQWFLVHAQEDYLIADVGDALFATTHEGSWPLMWHVDKEEEVDAFLAFMRSL